jgi:hypothetical protein
LNKNELLTTYSEPSKVTELLLTIRMQIVGSEGGGETYLRAKSEALGHQ